MFEYARVECAIGYILPVSVGIHARRLRAMFYCYSQCRFAGNVIVGTVDD